MPESKQPNPLHDPLTSSDSERFEFVDPIGGLPLDDPDVLSRERRGRPNPMAQPSSSNERENPAR